MYTCIFTRCTCADLIFAIAERIPQAGDDDIDEIEEEGAAPIPPALTRHGVPSVPIFANATTLRPAPALPAPRRSALEQIRKEIDEYKACYAQPPPTSTLQFWKSKELIWSTLARTALRVLIVSPTSAESERTFSKAGNVCTAKRSQLKDTSISQLLFCGLNMPPPPPLPPLLNGKKHKAPDAPIAPSKKPAAMELID